MKLKDIKERIDSWWMEVMPDAERKTFEQQLETILSMARSTSLLGAEIRCLKSRNHNLETELVSQNNKGNERTKLPDMSTQPREFLNYAIKNLVNQAISDKLVDNDVW